MVPTKRGRGVSSRNLLEAGSRVGARQMAEGRCSWVKILRMWTCEIKTAYSASKPARFFANSTGDEIVAVVATRPPLRRKAIV